MEGDEGDVNITYIDTFFKNTGNGGYKTRCVLEVSMSRAKQIKPGKKKSLCVPMQVVDTIQHK